MTLEEIKKAFDTCCNTPSCTGCPLLKLEKQNGHGCKHNLFISAIGILTEQEKEIEELKKKQVIKEFVEKLKDKAYTNNYCQEVILKSEIDELLQEYEK